MRNIPWVIGINLIAVLVYTTYLYSIESDTLEHTVLINYLICGLQAVINLVIGIAFFRKYKKKESVAFFISIGVVFLIGFSACTNSIFS